VTFTAAVTPVAPGAGTPSGAVTFTVDGTAQPTANLAGGKASLTTPGLTAGAHQITASYSGDSSFLGSATASPLAQNVTCTVISGTRNGSITVTGSTCFQGATVNGSVTVAPGAALAADHSQINGGVSSNRATAVRICASTVNGAVSLTKTSGFVLIGDGADRDDSIGPCGGNVITQSVTIANSSGPVELGGNTVTGAVSVTGTTGAATELEQNHLTGALSCSGNVPPPTDDGLPNVATSKSGQCGAPGF
jgi:Bacterial Ig-like domain (group 3)